MVCQLPEPLRGTDRIVIYLTKDGVAEMTTADCRNCGEEVNLIATGWVHRSH